jgi:hypothetical protein
MFATWLDVADVATTPELTLPDIFGYGWDNVTGCHTQVKDFTVNTSVDGTCFWKYAADRALTSGTTGLMNYTIPCTTTLANASGSAGDPCYHYYMSGIYFNDTNFLVKPTITLVGSDTLVSSFATGNQWYKNHVMIAGATDSIYVIPVRGGGLYTDVPTSCGDTSNAITSTLGVEELSNNCSITVYPNPFHGSTNISVNLSKASVVSLSVTDMVGQKVYEINNGSIDAGTHIYTFDGSQLQSGIYYFTVKAGENVVTRKMIIE